MSTVHKHFPITSHPGTSWGQGPQVVFHVSNPLWGNRRKGKDGGEGLRIKYAIWEENLSKFSCADCFFFALKLLVTSFSRLWWWRWLQAARHHRSSSTSVIISTMDGGSFGSLCNRRRQAFQGRLLITPSGRERSQSPESLCGSMPTSRWSPVWLAVRHVEADVLALTRWWNDLLSARS